MIQVLQIMKLLETYKVAAMKMAQKRTLNAF